jgi:hypothetical protein
MLNLYYSRFAFDYDYNYIMLNSDNPNIPIISIKNSNKPGLDIYLDETKLEHCIPEIPSTIKYLRLNCRAFHYNNLIFPTALEYLKLHLLVYDIFKSDILDCITLPASIKSLSIILDYEMLDTIVDDNTITEAVAKIMNNTNFKIPKNIEYLEINFHLPNIEEYTNLKVLEISDFQNHEFNEPLDNLPESLEWLSIHPLGFNRPLANLPSGLKVLIFAEIRTGNGFDGYQHSLDELPSGLEILEFPEFCSSKRMKCLATLENLPPALKILRIPSNMPYDMNYNCLPNSIELLEWRAFRQCYLSRIPANLKKIVVCIDEDDDEDNKMIKYFENKHIIVQDFLDYLVSRSA